MARNPVLAQFVEDLKARYPTDGDNVSYSQWVSLNTKLHGKPFSYKGYEFQQAVVDDMARDLVVIKPSQVGMTEVQVRKFLAFLTRNRGTSGIFTFPNEKMFKSNSKTRIKPVIKQPVFNSSGLDEDKPTRAVNLYEINGSFAHITGLTEGDATSTPADILFHDELDLSDQSMIGLFQSRLQNSVHKITQLFSTPTHAGYGIDAAFQTSDMREYFVRCEGCRRHQVPKFSMEFLHLPGYHGEGNLEELDADAVAQIDLQNTYFRCVYCAARLNLGNSELREWVAERPGRIAHGYRIRPTATAKLDPEYIITQLLKMKRLDNLRGWKNTVLGETHSDGNSKLEPDVVKAVMTGPARPDIGRDVPVAVASDMGDVCHLTMGVIQGDLVHPCLFEQVPSARIEQRITELRREYNVVCGAVDRHPYTPTANSIRDTTSKIILPVEYRGAPFVNLVQDEYENLDFVQINRTAAIDVAVKAIQRQALKICGYGGLQQVVIDHLCDMVRIEHPEKPAVWEKLTGQDHFMHSLVLLQASIKIHQIVLMTNAEPVKKFFGLVGVAMPKATPGLGDPRAKSPERII